jgi:hypothetical protein
LVNEVFDVIEMNNSLKLEALKLNDYSKLEAEEKQLGSTKSIINFNKVTLALKKLLFCVENHPFKKNGFQKLCPNCKPNDNYVNVDLAIGMLIWHWMDIFKLENLSYLIIPKRSAETFKKKEYFQKIRLENFPLLVSSVEIGNSKKNGKVTEVEEPHNETGERMKVEEIVVTSPQIYQITTEQEGFTEQEHVFEEQRTQEPFFERQDKQLPTLQSVSFSTEAGPVQPTKKRKSRNEQQGKENKQGNSGDCPPAPKRKKE